MNTHFDELMQELEQHYERLVTRKNIPQHAGNGIFTRYRYPILTAAPTPLLGR